jgi:hypothetical protein
VLLMFDRNGKDRLELTIDCNGAPYLCLQDANGKKRAEVTVDAEGAPALQFLRRHRSVPS